MNTRHIITIAMAAALLGGCSENREALDLRSEREDLRVLYGKCLAHNTANPNLCEGLRRRLTEVECRLYRMQGLQKFMTTCAAPTGHTLY